MRLEGSFSQIHVFSEYKAEVASGLKRLCLVPQDVGRQHQYPDLGWVSHWALEHLLGSWNITLDLENLCSLRETVLQSGKVQLCWGRDT